ncbi:MAG: hypothetical protein J5675_05295 [Bacteroidales bacterium]|nr:hypothetical protein [Bacteroidales bacterium]
MEIPNGSTPEDKKARKSIIGNYYTQWFKENPERKIWNDSLQANIHVKNHSINETKGHASGTYESTEAVMHLTDILRNAIVVKEKTIKKKDNNQKIFSKMIILRYKHVKLTVGFQKSKGEYVQYCITVPGARMNKKTK